MFFLNVLATLATLAGAAPVLRTSSIYAPRVVTRGESEDCMMYSSMMNTNLAGAMQSMAAVQMVMDDENVGAVLLGINGATASLMRLNGALLNDASLVGWEPSSMVNNITSSLAYIDEIAGVLNTEVAAEIDTAQQELQNASQFAMSIVSSCVPDGAGSGPEPARNATAGARNATEAGTASESEARSRSLAARFTRL